MSASLRGKNVLVTGGTGFVGGHLLPLLVQAGAHVACLSRNASAAARLPAGVAVFRADLGTGEGLERAFREAGGPDVVIHMAALLFGLSWQDYLRANASAARSLFSVLDRADPERVVLVSSLAAVGPCAHAPGRAEDVAPAPVSAYGWSKLLAEQILRPLGDRLVIVRPPIIYGSGDRGLLPVFRGALRGVAVSPGLGREFPVSALHAEDVARAVLCVCAPQARGVYHLDDGRRHTMASFCQALGQALYECAGRPAGGRVRVLRLPLPLMAVSAGICTAAAQLAARFVPLQRAPNWNFDKYREARQEGWLSDASRIRRELGWEAGISLADGLREAARGYLRDGWL
ncbi:MAG: NAD(P)-dependent oxidoreductase [Desulfovibrio sp.]|jgi:nucleoside-diphosphate-sugar epimerase|nr:NAD(P)-dependent oxidoreductase [Desulfovibrio sp.]